MLYYKTELRRILLTEIYSDLTADGTPFRFGKDADGNYGYIITDEAGADSVIPFSKVEIRKFTATSTTTTAIFDFSDLPNYQNYSANDFETSIEGSVHLRVMDTYSVAYWSKSYNADTGILTLTNTPSSYKGSCALLSGSTVIAVFNPQ